MSGHSHWAGIKHQKGVTDRRRGVLFSKLLLAITAAGHNEPNPDFNPRLRSAIDKAKENNVPADNIARAISRARTEGQNIVELWFEAYGPGGTAIFIEVTSDNRNRAVAEMKKILNDHGGKWAEGGSVRWAFEPVAGGHAGWRAKFPQTVSAAEARQLAELVDALGNHPDVQNVFTNTMSEKTPAPAV